MFNLRIISLSLLLLSAWIAEAQPVNWAKDVAPILYDHCVKCHREGGIGHFSLVGYGNASSNRNAIQDATETRRMPPWKPDPAYRHFVGENKLTDAEIQTIKSWVEADAPPGDLSQAPADPVFPTGSEVGDPDHMLMTPFYTITATEDEYRCFVIPNGLAQDQFLRGLEAIPGNHEAVHHILIYEDTTGQGRQLDLQTIEPGYVNFGGPGVQGARLVGAWVPGAQTLLYPPFMGVKLKAGADLIVQMHFPSGATGMSDITTLNFFFTPTNQGIREVKLAPILNHSPFSLQNYPLNIPANTEKEYHAKFTMPANASFMTVAPHMHLIGRSIKSFGVTIQGDTIPLINIPDWDFHWQGGYAFQKVQKIPIGTALHAYATYDNTLNNPHQPSDPPQNVVQGEGTTDEMMLVYFAYMAYQPGDENIVLDSTLLTTTVSSGPASGTLQKLELYPNPTVEYLNMQYTLAETSKVRASILDQNGRVLKIILDLKNATAGEHIESVQVRDLPPGLYYVEIQAGANGVSAARFVKE